MDGRDVMGGRCVDSDLAGQHDLAQRAGADALDGAGDGLLVMLGRHRGGDLHASGGLRVQQRQRQLAQRGHARVQAREEILDGVIGPGQRAQRHAHLAAPAMQRDLGHVQRGRLEAGPVRCGRPVLGEGEAADGDRAAAGRAVRRVERRIGHQPAPLGGHAGEAIGTGGAQRAHAAQPGQRAAVAVGLLEDERRLVADARGEGHRGRIHVSVEAERDRRQRLAARARTAHRTAQPPLQPPAIARAQRETVGREGLGGHESRIVARRMRRSKVPDIALIVLAQSSQALVLGGVALFLPADPSRPRAELQAGGRAGRRLGARLRLHADPVGPAGRPLRPAPAVRLWPARRGRPRPDVLAAAPLRAAGRQSGAVGLLPLARVRARHAADRRPVPSAATRDRAGPVRRRWVLQQHLPQPAGAAAGAQPGLARAVRRVLGDRAGRARPLLAAHAQPAAGATATPRAAARGPGRAAGEGDVGPGGRPVRPARRRVRRQRVAADVHRRRPRLLAADRRRDRRHGRRADRPLELPRRLPERSARPPAGSDRRGADRARHDDAAAAAGALDRPAARRDRRQRRDDAALLRAAVRRAGADVRRPLGRPGVGLRQLLRQPRRLHVRLRAGGGQGRHRLVPVGLRGPVGRLPGVAGRAGAVRSRRGRGRWRSRRCASSRPGRTGAPCARRPRSCRSCRSPRWSATAW